MSESILTKVFGIKEGYDVVCTEYEEDFLRLHLDVQDAQWICPKCDSGHISRKGRRPRELPTVPIGLTPVSLVAEVPDCQCRDCGQHFEVAPPWPQPMAGSPIDWWCSCKTSPKSCASPTWPA